MAEKLHADFESRSTVDLLKVGLDNYAKHPTTDIWCMSFAFNDEDVDLWTPGEMLPQRVVDHIESGGLLYGHNVNFEWTIWNEIGVKRYSWPELKIEQCRCTMAMAYAMALPGALEKVAAAVGLDHRKDMKGHRLMLQMSKPRRIDPGDTIIWWDDPDRLKRLYAYCIQDTVVEREVEKRLVPLSKSEQAVWFLDQKINARGVPVDIPTIKAALNIVAYEKERLDAEMVRVTDGWVSATSNTNRLNDWLVERGVKKPKGVAKQILVDLLERDDIPKNCRQTILLRQEAGKTSTAKMDTMIKAASADGRVRGTMQYHGAATGRWAGRRIQPHNFPRPTFSTEETEDILSIVSDSIDTLGERVQRMSMLYGPPMDCLSSSLRGLIQAPEGKDFCCADFANIEGRKMAWLVGEDWKLQAFRDYDARVGPDLYLVAAGEVLGLPPEECKPHRQSLGKTTELAFQYQGGVGACLVMAKTYGLDIASYYDVVWESSSDDVSERVLQGWKQRGVDSGIDDKIWKTSESMKIKWRDRHPRTVQFWYDIEEAAISAVANPGAIYSVGATTHPIKFRVNGSFLWCQLPSKRVLCYCYPRLESKELPWSTPEKPAFKDALVYKGVKSPSYKWQDISTYGGKLAENVTQAAARDILVESMTKVEDAGLPISFHVHDEIICEVDAGIDRLAEMSKLMEQVPSWAEGLPIAVEGWQGMRYRK